MSELLESYKRIAGASLTDARALPFAVYHDDEIFQLEAARIFHKEWIFICAEKQLPDNGDYFACDLAGEEIVVIRGGDGVLRALSNNCRHRGTPLLDHGIGNVAKNIVCPYHAWTYDTAGGFVGAPFPGAVEVEKTAHCLGKFHLGIRMGLVFVNLSARPAPLAEHFQGIEKFAAAFNPSRFDTAMPAEEERWRANWKLVMENAMESYHLFKVHKNTLELYSPTGQAYYVAGCADWTLTGGRMTDNSGAITKWFRSDYPEVCNHYLLFSLPPSFVGVMTSDSFAWIHVLPDGSRSCIIRSGALMPGPFGSESRQEQDFTAAFFAEDKWICERVQKGMYSRQGRGGKLVEMERVVVDFHQFLASRLFGCGSDAFFDNSASTVFNFRDD